MNDRPDLRAVVVRASRAASATLNRLELDPADGVIAFPMPLQLL